MVVEAPVKHDWNPPVEPMSPLGARPEPVARGRYPAPSQWEAIAVEGSRVRLRREDKQFDERWTIEGCTTIDWDERYVDCNSKHPTLKPLRVSPPVPVISITLSDSLPRLRGKAPAHGCPLLRHGTTCNPPPPSRFEPGPGPAERAVESVHDAMQVGASVRVRIQRPNRDVDKTWRARFLDDAGKPVVDGDCTITDWDWGELECEASPWIAEVTHRVEVLPP